MLKMTVVQKSEELPPQSPDFSLSHSQSRSGSFRNNVSPLLFDMMIKYFLLSSFTVFFSLLFTASDLVLAEGVDVAEDTGDFTFYSTSYAVYFVMGNVDSMVSILFVLLSFSFTDRCYSSWCDWTHLKCVYLWSRVHLSEEVTARLSVIHSPTMRSTSRRSSGCDSLRAPSVTSPSASPHSSNGVELETMESGAVQSDNDPQGNDPKRVSHLLDPLDAKNVNGKQHGNDNGAEALSSRSDTGRSITADSNAGFTE